MKKRHLSYLAPPLILYGILFFPDTTEFARLFEGSQNHTPLVFSAENALSFLFLFYLPAIALCALAEKAASPPAGIPRLPRKAGLCSAFFFAADTLIILGVLLSLGAAVYALSASFERPFPAAPVQLAGASTATLIAAGALLFFAAILEELFFRRYLITIFMKASLSPLAASLLSTLLFVLPHVWEGPFGMINALLAGLFLAAVYLHTRALAPLALAHGLYNSAAVF